MSARLEAAIRELADALLDEMRRDRPATPDRLLSVDEAAAVLGVGRSALYGELRSGRLRSIKVGRRRLIAAGALSEYVAAAAGATSFVEART